MGSAACQCTLGTGSQVPGVTGAPRPDYCQPVALMLATLPCRVVPRALARPQGSTSGPYLPHLWQMGLCYPLSFPERPADRTTVSGPQEGGSSGYQRRPGICSTFLWHLLPLPYAAGSCLQTQGPRQQMCQSPFTASPADLTADSSAPANPLRQSWHTPWPSQAWPPACLCSVPEFFLEWRKEPYFFLSQLRASYSGLVLDSAAMFPGKRSSYGLKVSPCQAKAATAASFLISFLPTESTCLYFHSQCLSFWSVSCSVFLGPSTCPLQPLSVLLSSVTGFS